MIIDPYQTGGMAELQTAAGTPCPNTTQSPFCSAANGIYLRINWCAFELAAVPSGSRSACNYYITAGAGGTSPGSQTDIPAQNAPDYASLCPVGVTKYDTCATGTLATALGYIAQINANRGAIRGPLNIEIGLAAGYATPVAYLANTGGTKPNIQSVALPASPSSPNPPPNGTNFVGCVQLPVPWTANFLSAYDNAVGALISAVAGYNSGTLAPDMTVIKDVPVSAITEEFNMDGLNGELKGAADPNGQINCPGTHKTNLISGAQVWLNQFPTPENTQSPVDPNCTAIVAHPTLIQAVECAFGRVTGHIAAVIQQNGLDAILSLPTNNGQALPYLNCGVSGAGTCTVQPTSPSDPDVKDQWSIYYLYGYAYDLFQPSSIAYQAASAEFSSLVKIGSFSLLPGQLALDWTALSEASLGDGASTTNATTQLTCGLNNKEANSAASPYYPLQLNGSDVYPQGVPGTLITWQTATNQGQYCSASAPNYNTVLQNGVASGGILIEIEPDAAFTNLSSCVLPLHNALTQLLAASPPGTCLYPSPL